MPIERKQRLQDMLSEHEGDLTAMLMLRDRLDVMGQSLVNEHNELLAVVAGMTLSVTEVIQRLRGHANETGAEYMPDDVAAEPELGYVHAIEQRRKEQEQAKGDGAVAQAQADEEEETAKAHL